MTTVDLYKKHKAGGVSREKFLYEVRRDAMLPFITNLTSYSDAVQILKNKGIIKEESFPEESAYNQGRAANKAGKSYMEVDKLYSKEYDPEKYEEWTDGWMDAESEGQMAHDTANFRKERGGMDEAGDDYNPDAAWQEGYDAFEAGSHQEENPYEGDTTEHKNWDMGYEKAQHDGPGVNEAAGADVDSVVNAHTPELINALNSRRRNREDVAAYRKVENLLEKMATKLGCRTDVAFMEDEMFSGKYSAKEVVNYIKEMFTSELNDMGLNEDPVSDKVEKAIRDKKLDPKLVQKAALDAERGNPDALAILIATAGMMKENDWIEKDKFDDFIVGDDVEVAGKEGEIIKIIMHKVSGERKATIKFKDGSEDEVSINTLKLLEKTSLHEAAKHELTLDNVNPYEFRKGMQWELGYATKPAPTWDENTASQEDFDKAGKKVLKNLSSDPNYYTNLVSNKGEKPKKVKEVKVEEDGMAKIKGVEKVTANVQTSLGKKERGKKNPEGVKEMRGTKKTFSKIKLMKEGDLNAALDKNLRKLFK